jgi:glycerol-3-phosphate acyltransferase PlsY
MNDGIPFPGIVALSLFGLLWLAAYLYALYWFALRLGRRVRSLRRPWASYVAVLVAAAVISAFAWFLPADAFTRFVIGLVVFVAHAHPFLVGFWVAAERARREDLKRWAEQTEAWLSDWERTPKD